MRPRRFRPSYVEKLNRAKSTRLRRSRGYPRLGRVTIGYISIYTILWGSTEAYGSAKFSLPRGCRLVFALDEPRVRNNNYPLGRVFVLLTVALAIFSRPPPTSLPPFFSFFLVVESSLSYVLASTFRRTIRRCIRSTYFDWVRSSLNGKWSSVETRFAAKRSKDLSYLTKISSRKAVRDGRTKFYARSKPFLALYLIRWNKGRKREDAHCAYAIHPTIIIAK